jgi:glycosyltransferase involved in cell wall biosynthesis
LLVIGGPTLWSDYSAHLADLNPEVAEYVGGVPTGELPALLRSAAMLLVPSRYEPGSIVTAEALGCGLPVVLSDEVGNSEVVAGPHVRLHRAGDADGLEAAVRSLLGALGDDEPLRAAARADAEAQFAVSNVVSQLIDIIASLAPGAAARPVVPVALLSEGRPEARVDDADALVRR